MRVTHGPPLWPRSVDGWVPDALAGPELWALRALVTARAARDARERETMESCCADPANRETQPIADEQREQARRTSGATPGLTVCRVCGRRHYSLTIDPVSIGLTGALMGGG
jgi:hypothetical protein